MLSGKPYETIVRVYSTSPKDRLPDQVFWDGENFSLYSKAFIAWGDEPISELES